MKIGVFDSGVGGLTVLKALLKHMPANEYVYLADSKNAPYGAKSESEILRMTTQAVQWLLNEQAVDLVVLACNTASTCWYQLPIDCRNRVVSIIEPTVNRLRQIANKAPVGLVATTRTVQSGIYQELLRVQGIKVFAQAAPEWVPIIESGDVDFQLIGPIIKKPIDELMAKSPMIRTILLGCTHFPIIESEIRLYTPQSVCLINQGKIVADFLSNHFAYFPKGTKVGSTFFTTGNPGLFSSIGRAILGGPVLTKPVDLASTFSKRKVIEFQ